MPDAAEAARNHLRRDALAIFQAGVSAVTPDNALQCHVQREGESLIVGQKTYSLARRSVHLIAFGKAAAAMAATLQSILRPIPLRGIVVTKDGHAPPIKLPCIEVHEASHPVPDARGELAALAVQQYAESIRAEDLVLVAISGGGSALLPLPAAGLTLADKQAATQLLLECGATIQEINTIRKHLSGIKGGRLAAALAPAEVCSLVISDVIGDPLEFIASGPTVPDPTTWQDVWRICERYGLEERLPSAVSKYIRRGLAGQEPETPKPGAPGFSSCYTVVCGNLATALHAAEAEARRLGYNTLLLTTRLQGEARHAAGVFPALAADMLESGMPVEPPACILTGGETTVTIQGAGKGGRNQELALAAVPALADLKAAVLLSAGTDGTDGPTDAAGAFADHSSLARALSKDLDVRASLNMNDSYHFFSEMGDLIITGPTGTNVMDLQALLVKKC